MAAKDGPTLVLASRSPRRREIMDALGVKYEIVPADIDEASLLDQAAGPEDAARRLALSKAEAVAKLHPEAHVFAADTVVCLSSRIFGKPADEQEATDMLKALRGKPHRVVTGLALLPPGPSDPIVAHTNTSVLMRPYTDEEIDAYVATGSPMDKAGAYGVQDTEFHPAAPVNGCYFNVVGLPLCSASEMLRQAGFPPVVDLRVAAACVSHRCPFAGFGH